MKGPVCFGFSLYPAGFVLYSAKLITRISKVIQESRFLNWTEHGVQLLKRRRQRSQFIILVFNFILLGLLSACFYLEFINFVNVELQFDVAHRHLLIEGSLQSNVLAQIEL